MSSTIERLARDRWNAQADEHNQWDMLGGDEQAELIDAEYAALERRNAELVEALEKLARLGNGDHYGNSEGNMIAREALAHSAQEKADAAE